MRNLLFGLAALGSAIASQARAEDVALTFDDLPTLSLTRSVDYAQETTKRLLADLVRHHFKATGFVNEGKLEGADRAERVMLLALWLDAGMDLGNHGYSHESLTTTPVDAYISDVQKGETVTRELLASRGRAPRYYRYPYLETGTTPVIRATFERWLAEHGYKVAPVTIENSDWLFALVYDDDMLKGDLSGASKIQAAYLAYTARIVPWYEQAAIDVLGRRPSLVMLLHASRLNAASLDQIARILSDNGLRVVSLDKAMEDPAYVIADSYIGPDGLGWLTRWGLTLHKDLPWRSLPQAPVDIAAENTRLNRPLRTPIPAGPPVK